MHFITGLIVNDLPRYHLGLFSSPRHERGIPPPPILSLFSPRPTRLVTSLCRQQLKSMKKNNYNACVLRIHTPPIQTRPHDYRYHWFILDPKSKLDKVKVTNFKNLPKLPIFKFWKKALHATHLLKLLANMCKYEKDPTSAVEDTEQTPFCPQTDRQTRWNQYTPLQLYWAEGIIPKHFS